MNIKFFRLVLFTLVIFGVGISSLSAQVSLQAKIDYMEKLKKEAGLLEEQGYYDESAEKSQQVKELAAQIDNLVAVLKKWYLLQRNIAVAKQIGADKIAPEEFNMALNFYKSAESAFADEDLAKAEKDIEDGLYYIEIALEKTREYLEKNPKSVVDKGNIELERVGKEYVVRLIPSRRDCLWRIAEYDFIYGNPWQWKKIYEANRDIIKDPDLIYPNQRLIIPPLPFEPEL